jgi:hypothetical protein
MGVFEKAGMIFGGPKKPTQKQINDEQKKRANRVQELNNQIRAALVTLKIEDLTHTIPPETLERYDNIRKGLAKEFDGSPVKRLDIVRMEELTLQMVEKLQSAIRKGDTQTVSWILKGLYYSTNEARKDITESQQEHAEDIQEKRENMLEKYVTAVSVSAQQHEKMEEIRVITGKISRNTDERNKKKSEMDKMLNEKPYLTMQLQEAGSPETIKTPELMEAATLVTEVYDLNDTIKDLASMEKNLSRSVMQDRESIRMIDAALSQIDFMMSEEDMDTLRSLQDEIAQSMADSATQSKELQEIIDRHHLIFENWLKNQANYLTAAARKFQKMKFLEKREEQERIRAEKLKQEMQDAQKELIVEEAVVNEEKILLENE